ncbi:MAG: Ig-like domain-containing protein, partial [Lachnospiraceae bacterium]|nr:Ig-like domain-containing protein [Lachnospiraceae bacterium]
MRNIKKATATMLATAVIVTSAGVYDTGAATTQATTLKILNGKVKKITAGESFKVEVKASGKVKFKSGNKKIAKVSKKGVVKAIKPGKVTITVKSASKSAKVKVTVNPAKVKAVSATSGIDQAKVTWTKVKNATGYEV